MPISNVRVNLRVHPSGDWKVPTSISDGYVDRRYWSELSWNAGLRRIVTCELMDTTVTFGEDGVSVSVQTHVSILTEYVRSVMEELTEGPHAILAGTRPEDVTVESVQFFRGTPQGWTLDLNGAMQINVFPATHALAERLKAKAWRAEVSDDGVEVYYGNNLQAGISAAGVVFFAGCTRGRWLVQCLPALVENVSGFYDRVETVVEGCKAGLPTEQQLAALPHGHAALVVDVV